MCVQWAPGRVCVDLVLAPPSPRLLTRSACPVQPPNRVAMHKPFADCRQCKKARIRRHRTSARGCALFFFSIKSIIPLITGGSGGFARASSQDFGFFCKATGGHNLFRHWKKWGKILHLAAAPAHEAVLALPTATSHQGPGQNFADIKKDRQAHDIGRACFLCRLEQTFFQKDSGKKGRPRVTRRHAGRDLWVFFPTDPYSPIEPRCFPVLGILGSRKKRRVVIIIDGA